MYYIPMLLRFLLTAFMNELASLSSVYTRPTIQSYTFGRKSLINTRTPINPMKFNECTNKKRETKMKEEKKKDEHHQQRNEKRLYPHSR